MRMSVSFFPDHGFSNLFKPAILSFFPQILAMLRVLNKIRKVGIITEANTLNEVGTSLPTEITRCCAGSLAIRQLDAGSCNGCELEIQALNNSYYDIERFGIHFVASPRHADLLLITGPVSRHMQAALLRTYEATPHPKLVVAAGTCATDGGEFGTSYASCGAVSQVLKVAATIPGCPPTPLELIKGILSLLKQPGLTCQNH